MMPLLHMYVLIQIKRIGKMMPCLYIYVLIPSKKKRYILDICLRDGNLGFHQNSGFLMVPGIILEICLNLGKLLTLWASAAIILAILSLFSLS